MKKKTKIILIIFGILFTIQLLIYGITFAKYASTEAWNYYLKSKGFYFNSDVLKNNNVDNNWDGNDIHFDVKNSYNSLIATDYDIKYKVTCNIVSGSNGKCLLNNTTSNVIEATLTSYQGCVDNKTNKDVSSLNKDDCINSGYEYKAKETKKDMFFNIESEDNFNNVKVELILESTYPYKKTIKSQYILSRGIDESGSTNLIYDEYDDYSNVIISNSYTENKCIKLTFDSDKFRIDDIGNIKYNKDKNNYINEVIFNIDSKSSKEFKFYRIDNKINYSSECFSIQESNEC